MINNIACRTCGKPFESRGELATHIYESKDALHKRDRAGKMWAKRYIYRNTINKMRKLGKKKFEPRQALTDEQKEAKEDTRRELSGQTKLVPVKCPRCKIGSRQFIEVEHVDNPQALRIDNCYVILCEGCR